MTRLDLKPLSEVYQWEIETSDGIVLTQYDSDGNEREGGWTVLDKTKIVRASFVPQVEDLPRHDCLIDIGQGEQFVKRFGRGFMKLDGEGYKLKEYLQCFVTNKYRLYVFSDGRCLLTRFDYEVYL